MEQTALDVPDLIMLQPKVFEDKRGFFLETYRKELFGSSVDFIQDNHSGSVRNVLRGMHFQTNVPQAKLVRVIKGEINDVAIDIRVGSPWFGKWCGVTLSESNRRMLYVPVGFAHGFFVLSEWAEIIYKCSEYYSPANERTILWNDPDIGIDWPIAPGQTPVVSDKDALGKTLSAMEPGDLPVYSSAGAKD